MITHEIQPNLMLFEPHQITSTLHSLSLAALISKDLERSRGLLPFTFNLACLNVSQNEVPSFTVDSTTFAEPMTAGWETLIKTHSAASGEFLRNPYVFTAFPTL